MPNLSLTALTFLTTLLTTAYTSGVPLVVSPGLNYSTNPNITANLPSCTNLTLAPTIPCYTTLNTTAFLTNFNLTKAEVCAPSQPWTTCLLLSVYQVAGTNCTQTAPGVRRCVPFDCVTLNSSTCVQPRRTNRTDVSVYDARGWYGVWNVYSLHKHVKEWARAINQNGSEPAILAAINPRVANTATDVLKMIIGKYQINPNADGAIVKLLERTAGKAEKTYGNGRVRGEVSTLSGMQWRRVLYERLEEALEEASAYDGFDKWIGAVSGGAFSTRGLSGVDALARNLRKG